MGLNGPPGPFHRRAVEPVSSPKDMAAVASGTSTPVFSLDCHDAPLPGPFADRWGMLFLFDYTGAFSLVPCIPWTVCLPDPRRTQN